MRQHDERFVALLDRATFLGLDALVYLRLRTEVATEVLDSRLVTYARDTSDVVGGATCERLDLSPPLGWEVKLRCEGLRVVVALPCRVIPMAVLVDALVEVGVGFARFVNRCEVI